MKKKSLIYSIFSILSLAALLPVTVRAAGVDAVHLRVTASPASVVANNSSLTTITISAYTYQCSGSPNPTTYDPSYCAANGYGTASEIPACYNTPEHITVSGTGNTLSAAQVTPSGSSCTASATLKSSVAGVKNIHVQNDSWPTQEYADTSITFTAPPTAPPSTTTKPKVTSTPTTPVASSTPAPTPTPPAAPLLSSVKVDGSNVKAATDTSLQVKQDQPLVLSGKTVPNGIVTLTIHSTPKTVTATADKDGNWSYKVTGLEPGDHTIQASVKDPATGQSSAPAQILAFTVKSAPAAVTLAPKSSPKKSSTSMYLVAVILILAAAAAVYWTWKKKRNPVPAAKA